MKISVDDTELFSLTDRQKAVIKNEISDDIFEDDMKRRLQWVLTHKYDVCLEKLKQEWLPILKTRVPSIPTSDDALIDLIFSQIDYHDRTARDLAAKSQT